jgi:hypothetical protein
MKRLLIGLIGGASIAGVALYPRSARSADHLDSPAAKADPAADIADEYAFMDGGNAVFAMTVFPLATSAAKFSDAVQYVIHTSSGAAFGGANTAEDIICTFNAAQAAQCWAGTDEYVTGDPSAAAGIASADGKFKVFAGLRGDPFFFNLDGFHHAEATVEGAGTLPLDVAGCPLLDNATAALLRTQLTTSLDGGAPQDTFAMADALAIVVSIDKSLVTKGGPIVATWTSTHQAP